MAEAVAVKKAYPGSTVLSEEPVVAVIEAVVSPEERAHIIELAAGKIKRAKVSLDTEYTVTEGRTGGNCWLRYDADPVVRRVGERIARRVGVPLAHAEAMQVIHYGPEQQYKAHYDAYDLSTVKGQRCCKYGGQRLVTGLVYLNEVEEGGATAFPKLDLRVEARPGRMVLFHNTGEDINKAHPDSLHAGTPVIRGEKWAFNIWFHARPMTEMQRFDALATESGSPSPAAQDDPEPISLVVNRASRLWQQALQAVRPDFADLDSPVCMTYWDSYGNSRPKPGAIDESRRVIRLIDREHGNSLANKRNLARLIRDCGLDHLAPSSYESVAEAVQDNPDGTLWFVKPAHGTAGKGMYCVSHCELPDLELPQNHILQKAVENLVLDRGRKFTSRVYLLLWNGEMRLFHTGFTVTHGTKYQPGSTDYAVQIDHRGYEREDSPVSIAPGHDSPIFRDHFPAQRELVRALRPVLSACLESTDQNRYLLLGIDMLLCDDGSVQLVEINSIPNFIHTSKVNREVNVPFFESVIRVMIGLPDERLELID